MAVEPDNGSAAAIDIAIGRALLKTHCIGYAFAAFGVPGFISAIIVLPVPSSPQRESLPVKAPPEHLGRQQELGRRPSRFLRLSR